MRTFGLGGDSEVALEDGGLAPRILLGPRRLVPLSLAAVSHGDAVIDELERQLRARQSGPAWTAVSHSAPACRSGWRPGSAQPKPGSTR